MVTTIAIAALLVGFFLGAATAFVIDDCIRWRKPAKSNDSGLPEWLEKLRAGLDPGPRPEAKKSPIGGLPRSLGSWRNQRRELERQHNSKQKERDQRIASL